MVGVFNRCFVWSYTRIYFKPIRPNPMKLKNGKFYDDAGNFVPTEHGNLEQIRLITDFQKRDEALKSKEGLRITYGMFVSMQVNMLCPCGQTVEFEGEGDDQDEAERDMNGSGQFCNCGAEYEIKEKKGQWFVKLVRDDED